VGDVVEDVWVGVVEGGTGSSLEFSWLARSGALHPMSGTLTGLARAAVRQTARSDQIISDYRRYSEAQIGQKNGHNYM
jgi:hypothetical protein